MKERENGITAETKEVMTSTKSVCVRDRERQDVALSQQEFWRAE